MDIHTKTDPETKIQLIVIELDRQSKLLADFNFRLKEIEGLKLGRELQIISADIKDLKKKVLELNEFKNDFITARYNQLHKEPTLAEKIKKIVKLKVNFVNK